MVDFSYQAATAQIFLDIPSELMPIPKFVASIPGRNIVTNQGKRAILFSPKKFNFRKSEYLMVMYIPEIYHA